jgi:hypothetical protein
MLLYSQIRGLMTSRGPYVVTRLSAPWRATRPNHPDQDSNCDRVTIHVYESPKFEISSSALHFKHTDLLTSQPRIRLFQMPWHIRLAVDSRPCDLRLRRRPSRHRAHHLQVFSQLLSRLAS